MQPATASLTQAPASTLRATQVILTPSHLGIVMDLAPGGTLRAHMNKQKGGRLPEEQARFYFQQLVIAMEYCHRLVCQRLRLFCAGIGGRLSCQQLINGRSIPTCKR